MNWSLVITVFLPMYNIKNAVQPSGLLHYLFDLLPLLNATIFNKFMAYFRKTESIAFWYQRVILLVGSTSPISLKNLIAWLHNPYKSLYSSVWISLKIKYKGETLGMRPRNFLYIVWCLLYLRHPFFCLSSFLIWRFSKYSFFFSACINIYSNLKFSFKIYTNN